MINYYYKVNRAGDWPKLWLLSLNIIKCIVTINTYHINTISGNVNLQCVNCTKDLGIIVDNNLSFAEYINKKVKKANSMLGLIKRNFNNMNENTFILLYKYLLGVN